MFKICYFRKKVGLLVGWLWNKGVIEEGKRLLLF